MSGAPLLLWSGSCALSCFWGVWHVLHLRTDTTAFEITANVDDAESLMQEFGTQAQDHDLMHDSDGTSPGKNPRTEVGGAEEKPAKKRRTSTKGATNGKDDGPQEHTGEPTKELAVKDMQKKIMEISQAELMITGLSYGVTERGAKFAQVFYLPVCCMRVISMMLVSNASMVLCLRFQMSGRVWYSCTWSPCSDPD